MVGATTIEKPKSSWGINLHCQAEVLSGAEFVNSLNECEQLLRQFPETLANEPEGQGERY